MVLHTTEECLLKNKICYLQTQMLDFNRRISPVKTNQETVNDKRGWKSTFLTANLVIFKVLVCVTWPFVFPTTVYYMEGDTSLFYSLAGVSLVLALILGGFAINGLRSQLRQYKIDLRIRIQKLYNFVSGMLNTASVPKEDSNETSVKFFAGYEKFIRWIQVIGLISAFFALVYLCIIKWDSSYFIYVMILVMGYVGGLLTTYLCYSSTDNDLLPVRSPCVQLHVTDSSPVKKRLNFSNYDLIDDNLMYGLSPSYEQISQSANERLFY